MKDIRQTPEYAEYLRDIGWRVEKVGGNFIFIKHFPILGNFIKIQRLDKLKKEEFEIIKRKYKPFKIIVEPIKTIPSLGFNKTKSPYLPTKTLVLDLRKSEEEMLGGMRKETRRTITKLQTSQSKTDRTLAENVKLLKSKDIRKFREVWKKAVSWKRYVMSERDLLALEKNFKSNALFLIEESGDAGAVFLRTRNTTYYWQAFTNKIGRKKHLQYMILWEGMLWAKKNGCKYFDYEGIYDGRFPNKKWGGFSFFKKGFGGREVKYPGAFVWKKGWNWH